MRIGVAGERAAGGPGVPATPETVKKLKALGAELADEPRAGVKAGILDGDYVGAGATVRPVAATDADVVLKARRPSEAELAVYKYGALVIANMDPYGYA